MLHGDAIYLAVVLCAGASALPQEFGLRSVVVQQPQISIRSAHAPFVRRQTDASSQPTVHATQTTAVPYAGLARDAYRNHPTSRPLPYTGQPTAYSGQSTAYSGQPTAYSVPPTAFGNPPSIAAHSGPFAGGQASGAQSVYTAQQYIGGQSQRAHQTPDTYRTQYTNQQPKEVVPILAYSNELSYDGGYSYAFETADGISRQETAVLTDAGTPEESHLVRGSYSYTAPDGALITVTYIADKDGFRADGAHLPTPPPIPEAIARSLEYIAARQRSGEIPLYQEP